MYTCVYTFGYQCTTRLWEADGRVRCAEIAPPRAFVDLPSVWLAQSFSTLSEANRVTLESCTKSWHHVNDTGLSSLTYHIIMIMNSKL